jgi:hypothetical protein
VYGLAAVDCRGRIADQAVLRALGWLPGTCVEIREARGLLVIHAEPRGVFCVTVRLPKFHPCRSSSMLILVDDSCQAIVSAYVEASYPLGVADRLGTARSGAAWFIA